MIKIYCIPIGSLDMNCYDATQMQLRRLLRINSKHNATELSVVQSSCCLFVVTRYVEVIQIQVKLTMLKYASRVLTCLYIYIYIGSTVRAVVPSLAERRGGLGMNCIPWFDGVIGPPTESFMRCLLPHHRGSYVKAESC